MKFPNPVRFAIAMLRAAWHWFQGPILVTDEVRQHRRLICEGCEFFDPEWSQCEKCGCLVSFKVELTTEQCPVGKWRKSLTVRGRISILLKNARESLCRLFCRSQ